jgi:hypothetical protein
MKVETVCVPLDPDDCGSVISGYVRFPEMYQRDYGKQFWEVNWGASMALSDCSRVINWSFTSGDEDYNFEKLDRTIAALTKFREHMVTASNEMKKIRKEIKKRNLALDPEWKE